TSILVASATTWALVAISPSPLMTKPVPAPWPPLSSTLMLTTPGSVLLMRSETSVLTAGPDEADVVLKPWSDATVGLVLLPSCPAMAPPTVPPAIASAANAARAKRRRPARGVDELGRGGWRSWTGADPAGDGDGCSRGGIA